jgi:ABC-type transport system involved in multi-copper enzyme maturation permease subunit
MTWVAPHLLGGPLLHRELMRAARAPWLRILRSVYLGWLLVEFLFLLAQFHGLARNAVDPSDFPPQPVPREVSYRARLLAHSEFAAHSLSVLLYQQLLLLALATPALTAGALGHEKERGTLVALLGTQLGSWEIVAGKLLGRLAVLAQLALVGLPVQVLLAVIADVSLVRVGLALAQVGAITFALAAGCMLCSVWTRQTRDAILACYAAAVLIFLSSLSVLARTRLPDWLDPVATLRELLAPPTGDVRLGPVLAHLGVWVGAGCVCLVLAVARLRRACLRQLEDRPSRRLWAFRPPVGHNPIRWRECHVLGLAPLPWLRRVPHWMGMLGVLAFSGILAYTALPRGLREHIAHEVRKGEFARAFEVLRGFRGGRVAMEVTVMGIILLLIGALVVGVRCATSISEERRRKTWEDLVLTPLSMAEIVSGKMWGVLQATPPYLLMYLVPMLALGSLGGSETMLLVVACGGFSWLAMFAAACLGMAYSAGSDESRHPQP